ncbi:hypothetical protein EHQ58_13000 [Leptospira ognonensis]|uniref:Glycosyltransferase RgtA/B/C/D-like domain-containing protein n=1 Tax=Leptospira ognonensis TaxID=2484945 RepID=A0A4R9JZY3_9LEPT|nr:hypothetical protein [Leptospira ognonensis]TGL57218.1 hypothetical protein EHQ58_13000 [Leptospira ognonensis]
MKYLKLRTIFPILVYMILVVYLIQFRYKLDKNGPYFTSDGAIKIYQTYQYKENGLLSLECYYPSRSLDPNFEFYPISYPWAIFSSDSNKERCVLEYPPFFYWIGAILLSIVSLKILLYLPILFYSLAIFLFDAILLVVGFRSFFRIFIVALSFFSFPILTSIDYTESSFFLLIYLIAFYMLAHTIKSDQKKKSLNFLLIGAILGFSFFFRLEIIFPVVFLLICFLFIMRDIKNTLLMGVGFAAIASIFLLYNFSVSGHILGFRYVSSINLNENSGAGIYERFQLLKAYLWGDSLMIGIFQFNPLCFFMIVAPVVSLVLRKSNRIGSMFIFSGIFAILSIPFYVTFYGGVGYFGLRYLEAPFFLMVIGFSSYLGESKFIKDSVWKTITFVILSFLIYFNLVTTREGLKVLRSASADLHALHVEFDKSSKFVIHTSLYSSIWMGNSFLNKNHILTTDTHAYETFLDKLKEKEQFIVIQSPQDIYISSDIPKSLYQRYKTNVKIDPKKTEILEIKKLFGVNIILAKKK